MGDRDEDTDRLPARTQTQPDFEVRPAIEGDDPLAQGGWHSSGGTKATVVELDGVPPAPGTVLLRPATPSHIEVIESPRLSPARVAVMVVIAAAIAFALGRWTA